jgi:hypothetical protein
MPMATVQVLRYIWDHDSRCRRCGEFFRNCHHINTEAPVDMITAEHAERIKARFEIGKRFNPDHDNADYFTDP